MTTKCEVRIWFVGDSADKDSVMLFADSLAHARRYVKDWLNAHNYKGIQYKRDRNIPDRYNGKFACVYIVRSK